MTMKTTPLSVIKKENLCWYDVGGFSRPAFGASSLEWRRIREDPLCDAGEKYWRLVFETQVKNILLYQKTSKKIRLSYVDVDGMSQTKEKTLQGYLRLPHDGDIVRGVSWGVRFMIMDPKYPELCGLLCYKDKNANVWKSGRYLYLERFLVDMPFWAKQLSEVKTIKESLQWQMDQTDSFIKKILKKVFCL